MTNDAARRRARSDRHHATSTRPGRIAVTDHLAVLGEIIRLRLLRLLDGEELTVGELASIMQLPQSTVSRHLKVLLGGGWITRRSKGTAGRYRVDRDELDDGARRLWELAREQLGEPPVVRQDDSRLAHVAANRSATDTARFFGRVGSHWDALRDELFGRGVVDSALLDLIGNDWIVADIGCGTGNLTALLAPCVARVKAVDVSASMLSAARKRLSRHSNVSFHRAEMPTLPFKPASIDAMVISLVLHHVAEPGAALASAARFLKPGGRMLIVDMLEHDRDEYRRTMGHRWLGFDPDTMKGWMKASRLEHVRLRRLPPDPVATGPELFAATGRKRG